MKKSPLSKIVAMLLVVLMVVSALPISAIAASIYDDSNGGSDYYNVISEKEWDIAPGVKEYEQVLNNDAGTRRQVVHTAVVDVNNPFVKVIPGTKGMWPQPGNYGTQSTSTQALEAEKLGYGNVVVATNCSLSWYTEAYYKENPHLIGEPLGYSILDGQLYANSRFVEGKNGGGVKTIVVINYDNHPITGEPRPADMPKVWIRLATDPLTGWEQQAIPVLFEHLVKPDENGVPKITSYASSVNHGTSDNASRTFVGVRADGSLVIAVSDGEQAPYSAGFTKYEMAEYMIKMGCIIAANCDGGGSTTFCSQRPGEDLKVNCSLSDGGERPTSNTILVVSTAPADGQFARAQISTDYDYYTPGSSVSFNALGTDAVGTKVDIPADVTWQIKEANMGTIVNGIFTSNGAEGKVTAQMVYDGNVVGEKAITVVTPNKISFDQPVVTIPFGKTAKIPVKAYATVNSVEQEIGLGVNDVTFTTTNAALGSFDGLNFVAVAEINAPADITSTVTATLNMGTKPSATVNLNLGKGSEVLWDFEDGQVDIDEWNVINSRTNDYRDYYLKLSLADRTTGQVHDGNYSMRLETNGLASKKSDSSEYAWIRLGVDGNAVELENARRVGFWLYVPEDNIQCWVQGHYMTDSNGDGTYDTLATVSMMESENVYYNVDESGWYYMSMDISAFEKVALKYSNQFNKQDSNGQTTGQLDEKGEFFLAIITHRTKNNKLWSGNGTINGPFTYYLDSFTVDYSDAVDDRENPVFSKAYLDGTTALVKRDVVTTTNNILNVSAAVADATVMVDGDKNEYTLTNISGLNANSAKVYIDGVEVSCSFADGVITANGIKVADGYHRVKFEICDNAGNKSVIIRVVKVESGSDASTLTLKPADPTLDRIPFGSIYWMNLEANKIETIQSVETVIDLNSVNHWQLDHMELAEGFTAEYSINKETNTATITITRTGVNYDNGFAVLAKLPVRILYFDTDIKVPGFTAETYWTSYNFFAQDMKMDVDMGLITHTNGTTSTFSNEEFHVDTEMYTTNQEMSMVEPEYLTTHASTHVHTPVALDDKAPTCAENGYTGRTFCEGCNSVVEWGTTIPATGHTYEVVGDKLVCDCGRESKATGLQNIDGKNYYAVSGKLTGGWQMIDDVWYLFDKVTFAGVDGEQYTDDAIKFNFDNGRVTDGTWVKMRDGMRYWYGPSYYRDTSFDADSSKPFVIDGKTYLFNRSGYMQTGIVHFFTGVYDGSSGEIVYYDCGTDGVANLLNGPYKGYFYADGKIKKAYQLAEFEGDYYFIYDGHKLAKDCEIYLTSDYVNGHTYADGTPLAAGYYTFDADGKMLVKNGVIDGYMYINNERVNRYALIEFEGNFYYVGDYRKVAVNKTIYLTNEYITGYYYADGTPLKEGYYTFGADGKMLIKNGVIDGYMYINNEKVNRYALIEFEDNFYYVGDYRKVAVNQTIYLTSEYVSGHTYADGTPLSVGYYTFDAEGKMIINEAPDKKNGVIDGFMYIDGVKAKAYKLVKFEDNYYFVGDYHKVVTSKTIYLTNEYVAGYTYADGTSLKEGYYTFDAEGKMVIQNGVVDGYMYINNERINRYALVEFEGNFYYVGDYRKVAVNKTIYLTSEYVAGHTYADGTPLKVGYYTFDAEGKMVIQNGVVDGYMYINNERINRYALVEFEGNFYYVGDYRKVAVNKTIYLTSEYVEGHTYADGTPLKVGYYTFDAEGKMVIKNGVIDGFMYINNERVERYALIEFDGNYYYVGDYRKVATNTKIWLDAKCVEGMTYPDGSMIEIGYHYFDAEGKMVY
ncbi:MAG: hypothetical protein E7387_03865 [Ruminococcaceae bacterium]|nr:hypothetical protein [Oscillospiraceae bacterium]